jgi:ribonuclease HI
LYTELKQQLQSHYLHRTILARTTSHRVAHNLCRTINHAALQVRDLSEKIRNRILSQDAVSALELATKTANTNAITRRIEKALNPNKLVLNVADLSAEETARHTQFWSDRWGQTFELPPDRLLNIHFHLHPPPGVSPPARFSITHHPNGDVWLPDADEVTTAIHRLSNHRAPGPSGIPVDFFKLTTDFTEDLVALFGNIIEAQTSFSKFSRCRLVLLHKTGIISEPKNYRPINLTEAGFRIFESLLKIRLETWSESILHQDQYGFRRDQSTMSALFRIITNLHSAIARGTPLFICFLDAVKAFDRVPHTAILEAFMTHGLCSSSCRLLNSIISEHVSSVFNPDDPLASIDILIKCGVLQGGILSPLFFNFFANSMLTNPAFQSLQALYADDRTLIDSSSTQMQDSLMLLQEWASTRNLLHDGNEVISVNAPAPSLHIHSKPIPNVSSAKCLGLTIWETGKVERAGLISQTTFRTTKISALWHKAKGQAPFSTLKELLHRYMLPTTIYGSAFFTDNVGPSLDRFMFQILRKATLSHHSTNTALLCEFSGTIRPSVRIQQETISVLSRLLDNRSSQVRDAVTTQFNLGLPFASKVRKLLDTIQDYPLCGPILSTYLNDVLLNLEAPPSQHDFIPPPPFTPDHPSQTHFLAFTDGSTHESGTSGCSVILLIGDTLITSSFPLPGITENNAAEIKAFELLLKKIITLKATDFPDITNGTVITDSLNTVHALAGTSLLKDSAFVSSLHSIRKLLRSLRIRLAVKWVKAHDDSHSSPFNELADRWSGRSIQTGAPLTLTSLLQPEDISNATLPIPWHPSELPPSSLTAKITVFTTMAHSAILLAEDARYRDSLERYIHPHHINFPGTGSKIAKTATSLHAHWLLHLRRDPTLHFSEHAPLNQFNSPCPCCSSHALPTHNHLFTQCSMDRLSKRDAKKFSRSRQFILSLNPFPLTPDSQATSDTDLQHFFSCLTSSAWRLHDATEANDIVKHTASVFKIYHARRNSAVHPAPEQPPDDPPEDSSDDDAPLVGPDSMHHPQRATYHTGRIARLLILDRLEDCRSVAEFDSCMLHYDLSLDRLTTWARMENRPFYRPKFQRQWLSRIEHYLTFFNLPTHQLRYRAYQLWESQPDRAFASTMTLLPRPYTSSQQSGKRLVHEDIPGWIPKMNHISKLLRRSLLRYSPASPSEATRPGRRSRKSKGLRSAHHRRISSPSWAFSLNWSLQAATPLVEAWFAAPTSLDQRNLLGPAWPASWSKTDTITTRTNLDPDKYHRHVISQSTNGAPLVFLYDLIREALTSGELTTNPPFPIFTEAAQARQDQGKSRWFAPYEAAAVIMIFTPVEILRQRYSFTINPLNRTRNADFPPGIKPFTPRLSTYTHMRDCFLIPDEIDAIRAAHEWALDQMDHGRTHPRTSFPVIPADIPGPPSDSEAEPDFDFDDVISTSNDSDSSYDATPTGSPGPHRSRTPQAPTRQNSSSPRLGPSPSAAKRRRS